MKDAILVKVAARLEAGVGELIAGDDVDPGWIKPLEDRACDLELLRRDRMAPRRQGKKAVAVGRGRDLSFSGRRRDRILAKAEIFLVSGRGRNAAQLGERAGAHRRADVAIPSEPGDASEVIGGVLAGL